MPFQRVTSIVCGLILISLANSPGLADDPVIERFGAWTVTIQPGVRGSGLTDRGSPTGLLPPIRLISQTNGVSEEAVVPPAPADKTASPFPNTLALVQNYSEVYNSIPFSRAEYEAMPSYRHDATMEFLFGQMRPTVIQRGTMVIRTRTGAMPYGHGYSYPYSPYGFNSFYFPFYNMGIYRPYSLW